MKIFIIAWKWTYINNGKEDENFKQLFDKQKFYRFEISSNQSKEKKIVGFTYKNYNDEKDKHDKKEVIISEINAANSNDEIIVLLHSNAPDSYSEKDIDEIKKNLEKLETFIYIGLFSSGDKNAHPVYKDLIDEQGHFQEEAIDKDEQGKWLGINEVIFDNLWEEYYLSKLKGEINKLKIELFFKEEEKVKEELLNKIDEIYKRINDNNLFNPKSTLKNDNISREDKLKCIDEFLANTPGNIG